MASLGNATLFEVYGIWSILGIAILGLAHALLLCAQIIQKDKGNPKMQEV